MSLPLEEKQRECHRKYTKEQIKINKERSSNNESVGDNSDAYLYFY
jgi:hypothetical protein